MQRSMELNMSVGVGLLQASLRPSREEQTVAMKGIDAQPAQALLGIGMVKSGRR